MSLSMTSDLSRFCVEGRLLASRLTDGHSPSEVPENLAKAAYAFQ
jgi:hypothetical protein